ncbi:MAG: protein-export chaperone SecB, partial [Martelella sp.]
MAEENGAAEKKPSPALSILTQYIKDLSFENPGAPASLQKRDAQPAINISVNVNANPLGDDTYDVLLSLKAEAKSNEKPMFLCELVYGGVFRVADFPKEHVLPMLFIECPRLLFPFARQIVADATRNGGF